MLSRGQGYCILNQQKRSSSTFKDLLSLSITSYLCLNCMGLRQANGGKYLQRSINVIKLTVEANQPMELDVIASWNDQKSLVTRVN
jgi:hypothetical protein